MNYRAFAYNSCRCHCPVAFLLLTLLWGGCHGGVEVAGDAVYRHVFTNYTAQLIPTCIKGYVVNITLDVALRQIVNLVSEPVGTPRSLLYNYVISELAGNRRVVLIGRRTLPEFFVFKQLCTIFSIILCTIINV